MDVDGTIVESWKYSAKWTYEGVKGYQPVVAVWAEADVVLVTAEWIRHLISLFQVFPLRTISTG